MYNEVNSLKQPLLIKQTSLKSLFIISSQPGKPCLPAAWTPFLEELLLSLECQCRTPKWSPLCFPGSHLLPLSLHRPHGADSLPLDCKLLEDKADSHTVVFLAYITNLGPWWLCWKAFVYAHPQVHSLYFLTLFHGKWPVWLHQWDFLSCGFHSGLASGKQQENKGEKGGWDASPLALASQSPMDCLCLST